MENKEIVHDVDTLIGVELKNIHYIKIEADDKTSAFAVFKQRLEDKEVFVDHFTDIDQLIVLNEHRQDDIAKEFVKANKFNTSPIVWGGLYAEERENMLAKKYTLQNVVQNGTKKWETRYVVIGQESGIRHDITATTKGDATTKAIVLAVEKKESMNVDVEKVLISHNPTVATTTYLKDESEHRNIYMFMCNVITFDEEDFNTLLEDNMVLNKSTKQYSIKVETVLEYNKRVKV